MAPKKETITERIMHWPRLKAKIQEDALEDAIRQVEPEAISEAIERRIVPELNTKDYSEIRHELRAIAEKTGNLTPRNMLRELYKEYLVYTHKKAHPERYKAAEIERYKATKVEKEKAAEHKRDNTAKTR